MVANLAKGIIGEQAASLLGSLLVSHLQLVAMNRTTIAEDDRVTGEILARTLQRWNYSTTVVGDGVPVLLHEGIIAPAGMRLG